MPLRERILLTIAVAAAQVGLGLFVIGGVWLLEALGLSSGMALTIDLFLLVVVAAFLLTFAPGAPRWFKKKDR